MWTPWKSKTGLPKATTILATILLIATVSCGVNYAVAIATMNSNWPMDNFLMATGWTELAVMTGSAVGLLVVLLIWIARGIRAVFAKKETREDNHD